MSENDNGMWDAFGSEDEDEDFENVADDWNDDAFKDSVKDNEEDRDRSDRERSRSSNKRRSVDEKDGGMSGSSLVMKDWTVAVASFLARSLLKNNPTIPLRHRRIGIAMVTMATNSGLREKCPDTDKGIQVEILDRSDHRKDIAKYLQEKLSAKQMTDLTFLEWSTSSKINPTESQFQVLQSLHSATGNVGNLDITGNRAIEDSSDNNNSNDTNESKDMSEDDNHDGWFDAFILILTQHIFNNNYDDSNISCGLSNTSIQTQASIGGEVLSSLEDVFHAIHSFHLLPSGYFVVVDYQTLMERNEVGQNTQQIDPTIITTSSVEMIRQCLCDTSEKATNIGDNTRKNIINTKVNNSLRWKSNSFEVLHTKYYAANKMFVLTDDSTNIKRGYLVDGTSATQALFFTSTLASVIGIQKWGTCGIQTEMCPWLPTKVLVRNLPNELERLCDATVPLSVKERTSSQMTQSSISSAVLKINKYGFCVITGLLHKYRNTHVHPLGQAALKDLQIAAKLIQIKHGIDVYDPPAPTPSLPSPETPATITVPMPLYRELSMREDYRVDIRYGPNIDTTRTQLSSSYNSHHSNRIYNSSSGDNTPNEPIRVDSSNHFWATTSTNNFSNSNQAAKEQKINTDFCFFRGHPDLLEVIRRAMNPIDNDQLTAGNLGRYNFRPIIQNTDTTNDNKAGTFQSIPPKFQDLILGPVGAIISLPGAADQAIHTDTAHLFEIIRFNHQQQSLPLPPHYVNMFTPAISSMHGVGQTAFISQSHDLQFTAKYFGDDGIGNGENHKDECNRGELDFQQKKSIVWEKYLVRPKLELGDVVLFDCRIVHFGMSNNSKNSNGDSHNSHAVERPILYCNATMHWFTDPKNWDNRISLFEGTALD